MSTNSSSTPLSIAIFPWLAIGHITPFLHLTKAIAKRGHKLFFLSTPTTLQSLPTLPSTTQVPLRLPTVPGLPPDSNSTANLLPHQTPHLKTAFDGLKPQILNFLANSKVDWIVHDFASWWLPELAGKVGIKCVFFTTFLAAANTFCGPPRELFGGTRKEPEEFMEAPEWVGFETKVAFRLHEARGFVWFYKGNSSGMADSERLGLAIEKCEVVAIRSCGEFEPEWLPLLEKMYGKKVIPVGLLPPSIDDQLPTHSCPPLQWLDGKQQASTLYIALGSEAELSSELLDELAFGIELSGVPFLWALRCPLYKLLPDGFEDRTRDGGLVVSDWVQQNHILAHASVGAFLTHAGLNSTIEGLRFGVPLVALPLFGDQGLNARLMVEKNVGAEVVRNEEDGSFTREDVKNAIKMVMVEKDGIVIKERVKELSGVVGDRELHDGYVDRVLQYLSDHKNGSEP